MADLNETTSFDAEQLSEDIAKGEQKQPKVNVDADYKRSKEFAIAEVDKTPEGAKAAKAATQPKLESSNAQGVGSKSSQSNSNPEAYLEMAKEVNPNLEP
jgi:hypothetical protein